MANNYLLTRPADMEQHNHDFFCSQVAGHLVNISLIFIFRFGERQNK